MKKKIFFVVCLFVFVVVANANTECHRVDVLGLFDFEYGINWSIYRDNRQVKSFYLLRDIGVEPWIGHNPAVSKITIKIEEDRSSVEYIEWLRSDLLIEESEEVDISGYPAKIIKALETSLQERVLVYTVEIDDRKLLTLSAWLPQTLEEVVSKEFMELITSIRFKD